MPRFLIRGGSGQSVLQEVQHDPVVIGRSSDCDLKLVNAMVSRHHAEVYRDDPHWLIRDLGSRRGTRVNGRRLTDARRVGAGDEIEICDFSILFEPLLPADIEPTGSNPRSEGVWDVGDGYELIGRSPALQEVLQRVERAAPTDATILLTGESGTGKECVARAIHRLSDRSAAPFVVVNCPALPDNLVEYELFGAERGAATGVEARAGRLEEANRGTLCFDEVGDLSLSAQAKLLRFLQERTIDRIGGRRSIPVDVRVIAATNHDLSTAVRRGTFRLDLFYRLNIVHIHMPPLRDRLDDVPELVAHILRKRGNRMTISQGALDDLQGRNFPGNIRELQSILMSAEISCQSGTIEPRHLTDGAVPAVSIRPGTKVRAPNGAVLTRVNRAESAAQLYQAIVADGGSFWEAIYQPFRRGELSHDLVFDVIERGFSESRRSYRRMARLFGIDEHKPYRKLLDFMRNNGFLMKG